MPARPARLLVLATLRSDDGTVNGLPLPEGANVVRVPPLSGADVAAIAAHYLGPEAAEPAATLLAAASAGPPGRAPGGRPHGPVAGLPAHRRGERAGRRGPGRPA